MRVVADTNVLVSALVFPGGAPEAVYRLVLEGRVELVTSRPLLAELGRVLVEKFGWDGGRAEAALAQIVEVAEIVNPRETIAEIQGDPADNRVLETAAEGGVDAIVSGDRHLLELEEWRRIVVQPPLDGAFS